MRTQELNAIRELAYERDRQIRQVLAEVAGVRQALGRLTDGEPARPGPGVEEDGAEPLIAFVHIPKTAGGTARSIFAAAYTRRGIDKTGNYVSGPEASERKIAKRPGGWEAWHRRGGRLAVGHTPYGLFRKHLPADTRYMTFLREPVDRVLSHYYRHAHDKYFLPGHGDAISSNQAEEESSASRVRATSLEDALVELRLPQLRNLCTRFLCGHDDPLGELAPSALDDAKQNLRRFWFVGIQERFDESLVLLQRMLGLDPIPYFNRHVSTEGGRPTVDEISDEERALILEHNQLDAELYEFGLGLFEEAVAAAAEPVTTDAEALRALSAEANATAIQRARAWFDRELPVGASKEIRLLKLAADAAGIPGDAFKLVSSELPLQKRLNEDGKAVVTRVAEAA